LFLWTLKWLGLQQKTRRHHWQTFSHASPHKKQWPKMIGSISSAVAGGSGLDGLPTRCPPGLE
jgi:hypothetical protein